MSKLRFLSVCFFFITYSYSILIYYANSFQNSDRLTPCQIPVISSILPSDSTCFYRALFDGKAHISNLFYEKYKLENFEINNGMNQKTLWYLMNFSREFQSPLKYSEQEIEHFYWRYQKTAPQKTEELAKYLNYLLKKDKKISAQNTLNKFCGLYIKKNIYGITVIQSISSSIANHKVSSFDLHYCISLLETEYQPDWYKEATKAIDK